MSRPLNYKSLLSFAAAALMLGLGIGAQQAQADPYPGSLVHLLNEGTLANALFTVNSTTNTITATGSTSDATYWLLDFGGSTGKQQLVGIGSIYLVKPDGKAPPSGVTFNRTGFVQTSSSDTTGKTNWVGQDFNNKAPLFPGWSDTSGNNIWDDNMQFLTVSDDTDLGAAGKHMSHPQRYGDWTWKGFIGSDSISNYDIGIDYLLENGKTGRVYFTLDDALHTSGGPVPEPAFYQMSVLLALGGLGTVRLLKARRTL